jgi:hypothetical protein
MEGPESTEAQMTLEHKTDGRGFMAAGTGLFEWEQRIFGGSADKAWKLPNEAFVETVAEVEAEAVAEPRNIWEAEELGLEVQPAARAFWQRRKPANE